MIRNDQIKSLRRKHYGWHLVEEELHREIYDDEQKAWVACSDGTGHEFTYWHPLQEHNR